ncbi:hypothetical protein ACLB2K_019834 [Fragaria x ananassa]
MAVLHDHFIKLLLLGDNGVGKTSLLLRFSDKPFNASFMTTIGRSSLEYTGSNRAGRHRPSRPSSRVAERDYPHLLFYGPPSSGKKTLIIALIRQIFGPSADKVSPIFLFYLLSLKQFNFVHGHVFELLL